MATEEKSEIKKRQSEFDGGKILADKLYIVTVLFVLGFLWRSIVSFLLVE